MKKTAIITGNKYDWDLYKKWRNCVTKLNRKKKEIILWKLSKGGRK